MFSMLLLWYVKAPCLMDVQALLAAMLLASCLLASQLTNGSVLVRK